MARKKTAPKSRKKAINPKELIKMVDSDKPTKEIMAKCGFKTTSQFKFAYLNALMETGKVAKIKDGRAKAKKPVSTDVTIKKRGSVTISKDMVEKMGFKEGDKFAIRKTKAGISLKKL